MEDDYKFYGERKKAADENMKKTEEETKVWLDINENLKAYFELFNKYWSDSFIKAYPSLKARFMRYADEVEEINETYQLRYLETASKRLMDIQCKKLFDVLCQWDANLVTIEGINCSWDFYPWQENLLYCPFITPLTQEEVNLYIDYVDSNDFDDSGSIDLVDYESIRDKDEDTGIMPEWILFENNYTGNSKYLDLPMLRTEKEEFYRSLWRNEGKDELESKYESGELTRPEIDERPKISIYSYSDIEKFIQEHESRAVLNSFRKYYAHAKDQLVRDSPEDQEEGWVKERITDIFFYLSGLTEKIPVEANSDWRRSLIDAFDKYEKQNIKAAIPYAYSDYLMKRDLNIKEPKKRYGDYTDLAESVREQILRGRELNGEPRDFNF